MTLTPDAAARLISDLVERESVTPWLVPGGAGEGAVVAYLADWLADLPVEVEISEVAPGRPNLLATLRGKGGGPSLCLNAHTDTVGYAGWPDEALVPRRDGDRLYGLGAADDKVLRRRPHGHARPGSRRPAASRRPRRGLRGRRGGCLPRFRAVGTRPAIRLRDRARGRCAAAGRGRTSGFRLARHRRARTGGTRLGARRRRRRHLGSGRGPDAAAGLGPRPLRRAPIPRNGKTVFHTGTVRGVGPTTPPTPAKPRWASRSAPSQARRWRSA